MNETTLNVKGLDQLIKALKVKPPSARVGILGSKSVRPPQPGEKNPPSNADIGAAHEYGTTKMAQRSFLRMPITKYLGKRMAQSNLLTKETLKEVIRRGDIVPWLKVVAITAEAIVIDAFATEGFGEWPAWKDEKYENNTGQILVDTQQLRNSITNEVEGA